MSGQNFENPFGKTTTSFDNPFWKDWKEVQGPMIQIDEWIVDDLIKKFNNDWDFLLRVYARKLSELKDSLNWENLSDINIVLNRLLKTKDKEKIKKLMKEVQQIQTKYQAGIDEVRDTASKWGDSVKTDIWISETIRQFIWWSSSLRAIQDINIDGFVKSSDEFIKKIGQLEKTLKTLPEFKALSSQEQINIIAWLKKLSSTIESWKVKQLQFIDDTFDNFASQVEAHGDGWTVTIDVWSGSIDFANKQKAFDFILELKQNAEKELENAGSNFLDSLWNGLLYLILSFWGTKIWLQETWNIASYLNDNSLYTLKEQEDDSIFERWADTAIWLLIYYASIATTVNYAETIYRRVILDTIAKWGVTNAKIKWYTILPFAWDEIRVEQWEKTIKRRILRIPDYSTNGDYFGGEIDVALRNEYFQRIRAIEQLEETYNSLPAEEKPAFKKELNKIKTYLNVNTRTFWLRAWSLDKKWWKFTPIVRAIHWITGSRFPFWRFLRDSATQHFNLDKAWREKLEKDLWFIFDDFKIQTQEDPKTKKQTLRIVPSNDGWSIKESKDIKHLRDYISSRTDLSEWEKTRRLSQVDRVIENTKNYPVWAETVKRELFNAAERGYLSQEDIKAHIDKYLEKRLPYTQKKPNNLSWSEWKMEQLRKVSELSGKVLPATLTSKNAMMYKFMQIVENWDWNGSFEDLQNIFAKIDDWKLELTQIYGGKKRAFVWDFFWWFMNRYGISTPELTQLKRFSEWITIKQFKDIVEKWEAASKWQKDIKNIINSWIEIDWEIRDPIQAVKNYISYWIPDALEVKISERLNKYIESVESWKLLPSQVVFFREVEKIMKGFLPTHLVLPDLEKMLKDDKVSGDVKDYIKNSFYQDVSTWRVDITSTQLERLKKWDVSVGIYQIKEFWKTDKNDFIKKMEKLENFHQYDYQERLSWLSRDSKFSVAEFQKSILETYKDELSHLKVIYYSEWKNFNIQDNLKLFAIELKHWYTSGQASLVLERIFAWEVFSSIKPDLGDITIDIDTNPGREFKIDSKWMLRDAFKKYGDETSPDYNKAKAEEVLQFIKDEKIDEKILPQTIIKASKELDGAWEVEKQLKNNVAEIKRLTSEVSNAKWERTINAIYDNFNRIVSDTSRNINSWVKPYKKLIDEFNDAYDTRLGYLWLWNDVSKDKKPTPPEASIESPKEQVRRITKVLDRAFIEALLSWNEKVLDKIEKELRQINDISSWRLETVVGQINLDEFYMSELWLPEIRSTSSLPKLTDIRQIITEVTNDSNFAKPRSFGTLRSMIQSTTDSSVRTAIFDALDSGKLTR